VHWNRQRIEMGAVESGTPLTAEDVAALDALDEVLSRPELRTTHVLRPGELLVLDDHRVLHGRAEFSDARGAGNHRCLVRILLSREPAAAVPSGAAARK
jgi:alpha-ketoglutarate-dependent taurine dioxygenase